MAKLLDRIWRTLRHALPHAPQAAGEQLREVAKPTISEASDQANRTLDHAAAHGHKLLADAEERARRLTEDLDRRMDQQREQLLTRTEDTCDRVSRQLVRRIVIAGVALLAAAGAITLVVVWASRKL